MENKDGKCKIESAPKIHFEPQRRKDQMEIHIVL